MSRWFVLAALFVEGCRVPGVGFTLGTRFTSSIESPILKPDTQHPFLWNH